MTAPIACDKCASDIAEACDRYCVQRCAAICQGGCKLCGKPKQPWQVFCGAACSVRWESGEGSV